MSDELTGIFDNLTPGDFHLDTSAIDTSFLGDACGASAYAEWRKAMVNITWMRSLQEDLQAFAVLTNENTQRIFASDGDETPEQWAVRLQREARDMHATWFFLAMQVPARTFTEGEDIADIEPTTDQIEAALDAGVLDMAVCWMTIRADPEGSEQHAGMIRLNESGLPLDEVVGVFTDDNVFAHVLGGDRAL